jgi:hypothetical protein
MQQKDGNESLERIKDEFFLTSPQRKFIYNGHNYEYADLDRYNSILQQRGKRWK